MDALPVHQFQYTDKGWRERLVDIHIPGDGGANADGVKGGGEGAGGPGELPRKGEEQEEEPDFRRVREGRRGEREGERGRGQESCREGME